MRIGLSGIATGRTRLVEHAQQAEADGFTSLWFPGGAGGDALTAALLAGLETRSIGLGTAVVATYPSHPVPLAARAAAIVDAIGPDRFTLGVGPSHRPAMEAMYGLRYERPGQHTDEYVAVLRAQLAGEPVDLDGEVLKVHVPKALPSAHPVPVLLGALGARTLDIAGRRADGTILWMANAKAIATHVRPNLDAAALAAGRPTPRVVAGLPVAVHDDVDEARSDAGRRFAIYGSLPNYRRILAKGGATEPAEVVVVGDEAAVTAQLRELFDAGATDVWADVFPVGADRSASRERTMALLRDLVRQP